MAEVNLNQVEHQIARGFRWMRFQRDIESAYLEEYTRVRVRRAPIWAIIGTIIYNLVFFGDATMVPERLDRLMVVRFGVFTPFALLATLAVWKWPSARNYDLLSLSVVLLGGSLPMLAVMDSASPYLFNYQSGNIATFLFLAIGLRPRFWVMVTGLASLLAVHLGICSSIDSFDPVAFEGMVTGYVTISIFLAIGAYFQEQADRMNFLNRIRASLLQDRLQQQSERDELSGLRNRHSLRQVEKNLWEAGAADPVIQVLILDIDHFKLFNDVHGHLAGDDCIRRISTAISDTLGDRGIAFRYGGEEFLIILPGSDSEQALETAQSIRTVIERTAMPHRGLRPAGVVTASLGMAGGNRYEVSLQQLISRADLALYEAKRQGRNRVSVGSAPLKRIV
ncbi:MAG: GGDEF domain-containing protein [Rhizobium sp.]|nr:GGDEF domain-containing protein [Rhizobium sp.]